VELPATSAADIDNAVCSCCAPLSLIRTVSLYTGFTVGFGISPNLLTAQSTL